MPQIDSSCARNHSLHHSHAGPLRRAVARSIAHSFVDKLFRLCIAHATHRTCRPALARSLARSRIVMCSHANVLPSMLRRLRTRMHACKHPHRIPAFISCPLATSPSPSPSHGYSPHHATLLPSLLLLLLLPPSSRRRRRRPSLHSIVPTRMHSLCRRSFNERHVALIKSSVHCALCSVPSLLLHHVSPRPFAIPCRAVGPCPSVLPFNRVRTLGLRNNWTNRNSDTGHSWYFLELRIAAIPRIKNCRNSANKELP
jgi:hypothetical protein